MAKRKKTSFPRDKFAYSGPKLTKSHIRTLSFDLELPDEYCRFLLWRNGGDPPNRQFTWRHPKKGQQIGRVDDFCGFDPKPFNDDSRRSDLIWAIMKFRYWLPRWSIPVGFANDDDFIITFCNYDKRAGQIWLKLWCHDAPDDDADPDSDTFFVSKSFAEFVNSLRMCTDD